ncbi:RNA polymerase sigma-70 factor, ECF subfamily [Rhizobiales bacterium GAS113]|nr:RNA polymerase sigma-70 factor, ECF subfamily [Rhizobiales bacterium GAS113]
MKILPDDLQWEAPEPGSAASSVSVAERNAIFADLVLPYLDDAYALARWLTDNNADAEDVVQDAFLRAFRALGQFSSGNARAWVLTIVRHTAYRWLRKNRPAALVMGEDLESAANASADLYQQDLKTPETALIAKEDIGRLRAAIAALPAPSREVLVLRDLQGLAYREIAGICAVPVGTVMSRLARARDQVTAIVASTA